MLRKLRNLLLVTVLALLLILLNACAHIGLGGASSTAQAKHTPSIWPLEPPHTVTSEFGVRRSAGGGGTRAHKGLDIAAPKGTPVHATAAGRVVFAGTQSGYGKLVGIEHGRGIETWYAHLNRHKTRAGKKVGRGDVIGKVGATGNATGPHLHYEVRVTGKQVDPMPYLPPPSR